MITDADIRTLVLKEDPAILVEFYPPDYAPPFDPADAIKRYAIVKDDFNDDITFAGVDYERFVKSFGRIKRTTSAESNTSSVEIDNLTNEASDYEFSEGYEGLLMVERLISRSFSTSLEKSMILFRGRNEKPTSGSKASLSISAQDIIAGIDAEIPRRKFSFDDQEGRDPSDPLFEGFRFMIQTGVNTYSVRRRASGFFGWLGLKVRQLVNAQWSSFSDLDASRSVPEILGRAQEAAMNIAYADFGTYIRITAVFCEGEIQAYQNIRSSDPTLPLHPTNRALKYGLLGGTGTQIADDPAHPGNAIYSRTAYGRFSAENTQADVTDPAPDVIAVILGRKMYVPNSSNIWNVYQWTHNAAAHTYFLLTNEHYYNLDESWLDLDSFKESYDYNRELIFDSANSDVIFVPNTTNFLDTGQLIQSHFLSTGVATPDYFKHLNGDKTTEETFLKSPYSQEYDSAVPIEPPPPNGFPPGETPNLHFYLRERYTCNVIIAEQMKLVDCLHQLIFPTSRLYLTQGADGKIKLKNRKPVDWALSTGAVSGSTVSVDDVSAWIGNLTGHLLIDPHTTNSEVRDVSAAVYSNSVPTLTSSANISVTAFSGGNGANTPHTATITINTLPTSPYSSITLDGIEISFHPSSVDTLPTAAGFLRGAINAHPRLSRKFDADWTAGTNVVTVTFKSGTLALSSAVEETHVAPLANPTTAPTLTETASGTLAAGTYQVAYTYENHRGETIISSVGSVTIAANKKITVTAITLPAGATAIKWYVSPAANSLKLRYHSSNNGSSFVITSLPSLNNSLPPDLNRTACEVMRVSAVFSDRAEPRSNIGWSNVLKATYKWRLANRKQSINAVYVKFRDASQDFRLVELRLKDEAHIARIKKVNKKEINGQGIDNYHQAYRVGAAELAQHQDSNFSYQWSSDNEALLLEEGDVVCITDNGTGVYNLPVEIDTIEFDDLEKGHIKADFSAQKYSTTLYDDSVAERNIPVVIEAEFIAGEQ